MSKKIYLSPSNQTANAYATGNTNEQVQCKKIAKACFDYLKKAGFEVKCTYNMSMEKRVEESNSFNADLHIAIHTNATEKHNVTGGTQIYTYSLEGERKKCAEAIFKQLAPITVGTSAEKIIAKPEFYEVKKASGMTMYVEAEFHDTRKGSEFIILFQMAHNAVHKVYKSCTVIFKRHVPLSVPMGMSYDVSILFHTAILLIYILFYFIRQNRFFQ